MSGLSLYQITDQFVQTANILQSSDLDEQTIRDTLEGEALPVEEKARAVCAVLLNMDAEAEAVEGVAKKMADRASAMRKRQEWLQSYLLENMIRCGITEIKANDASFTARVRENPPKVVVDDEAQIPALYMTDPAPPPPPPSKPDKKLIAQALKDGSDVPGCRLERGKRLEIK